MQHILANDSPLKRAMPTKLLPGPSLTLALLLAGSALANLTFCSTALAANALEAPATLPQSLAGGALNYGLLGGLVLIGGLSVYGLLATIQNLQRNLAKTEREAGHYKSQLTMMHAVLASQPQIVIELTSGGTPKLLFHSMQSYSEIPAGSRELLDFASWVGEGRDQLKGALLALVSKGRAFGITVRTNQDLLLEVEGRIGGEALLVIRDLSVSQCKEVRMLDELENKITIMQSLFDALPMPVWFHDQRQKLTWVNRTYTKAVEAGSAQEVYEKQLELLEQRQIKAVDKELEHNKIFRQRMHTIIGGEPQAFETIAIPVGEQRGSIAIDVAAEESARGKLDQHIAAHRSTLDRVSAAVAFFNAEQRLSFFNKAYADFWELDENWLNTHPKDGEILDRLRATRMLPEQADYTSWKREWLSIYNSKDMLEDKWFLHDNRAVHVVADQSPDGGVIYMFDNLTDTINLQISFNELTNVQRETLDALREGVAVFATNGKLKLYNTAFTHIWNLEDVNLADEPHIEQVIHLCRALYDDDDD